MCQSDPSTLIVISRPQEYHKVSGLLRFRGSGSGLRVEALGVKGLGFKVQGLEFGLDGSGFGGSAPEALNL